MRSLCFATLLLVALHAHAQHQHPAEGHNPYAEFLDRNIKALSPDQVDDLLAGRGMGLSLAAELNSMPGPTHVLQMTEALHLTDEQTTRLKSIVASMHADAMQLGKEIVDAEGRLDRRFRSGKIDPSEVDAESEAIGLLNGRLRAVHLKAHLLTAALLEPDQIARYRFARGYGD